MPTFEDKANSIIQTFENCTTSQQNEILKSLLLKCKPLQLRILYTELKPLLSVDFAAYLPKELTERIFSYLSAADLCQAACASKIWRLRVNYDPLWQHQCKLRGWLKYGQDVDLLHQQSLAPSPATGNVSNTSPLYQTTYHLPPSLPPTCKWKNVYLRAYHLANNWATGKYTVLPPLKGHKERVTCFDSDGKMVVSGSSDCTVRIFEAVSGKCLHTLTEHSDSVSSIKLQNDKIVTGCVDGVVRVYQAKTGRCLKLLRGHSAGVDSVCFDGKIIISASCDKSLRVWDCESGKCLHVMRGHMEDIEFVAMYKQLALSASWDQSLRLWDIIKGVCIHTLKGHSEVVSCCQFDEEIVVSGGGDGLIKIWSSQTGVCHHTLSGHTAEIYCLKYNSDIIASGSSDSTVRLWNHHGVCLNVMHGHIGVVRCMQLWADRLITGGDQKKIIIWDAKTGERLNIVHRNPSLLHLLWVNDTKLIMASPEGPGVITILSYW